MTLNADLLVALTGLITAIAAAIALVWRTRAEVERTKVEVERMRIDVGRLVHELTPNSGTSARDAITRTETATHSQTDLLTEIHQDIGGLRHDLRRLAKVDDDDRTRADLEHSRMWDAINRITNRQEKP